MFYNRTSFYLIDIHIQFSMPIYSDTGLLNCFQVKTRPGVRFFGQNFRPVYEISAASAYQAGNYGLQHKWDLIIDFN